ncbi:nitrous oxide reductase family maturation protein NosD [Bacillus sp. ISL-40]|uniref:nitrous oxide reductase family maturation protein NosD n=1 Tax=unclassified Bacillus (in: firmicutes) TaxID=185979 RepID=UPI001BE69283|nr:MULTISPECIES: nitrous oxide reductase family maturation protein NosD [unclassified Bacillus (in: firmicutes)]MBT2696932.1 nitrous oxide reductase family maturation protein NosD [Bacillus sp. ISL-40]MBT2742464.1 nitrous oxide reductase family maturation protein NosD [Bacillus sp. ISL-77]
MKKLALLSFIFSLFLLMSPEKKLAAENLQATIDSLKDGAVLQLENKTYQGNIVINKAMTIIGSPKTVIKGDGTGNVISIKAPHVKLSHLTVMHGSMNRNSAEEYAAIKIYTNSNVVEHINIRDSFHGIYLSQAHDNTIRANHIKGMGKGKVAEQGNGIHVYYANNNLLEKNTIEGTRDGMFFEYANNNHSYENNISHTRYGLHYMYSDENIFKKNTFTMNTGGAAIMNSNHLKLEDNQFIVNYGNQSFGLLLLQANDNFIANNTFYMNQRGLYIDQATRNEFRHNKIVQNQIGIELWASSNDQVFTLNQISENTIPAVTLGGNSENNSWSKDGKGNDWGSAFPITDLNQDRIGDFPITYRSSLYQLMEDQELSYLFLKSPALKIYEKMNAALTNEAIMFNDPHPLTASNGTHTKVIFLIVGLLIVGILIKGRHLLCITLGRNGRKI